MSQDQLNQLNQQISEAIRIAERADDQSSAETKAAYLQVSRIEEQIADLTPATTVEGLIARRGAVRAALKAGDEQLAIGLVAKYTTAGINDELSEELQALLTNK